VKINGTDRTATAGIITLEIPAGSYQIAKADVANLFYISVVKKTTSVNNTTMITLTYPNPVRDMLYISNDIQAEKLEVYSLSGVLMLHSEINNNQIDLSSLNKGVYIVKISTGQGIINQRIIRK
jgi:hypothetical protein